MMHVPTATLQGAALALLFVACTLEPAPAGSEGVSEGVSEASSSTESTSSTSAGTAGTTAALSGGQSTGSSTGTGTDDGTTAATSTSTGGTSTSTGGDAACDIWAQDCPEGEKCAAWADDGGLAWNATRCVPAGVDLPGEPCTVEDPPTGGEDSCAPGAMCWDIDPETLTGACVGLCDGDAESPTCAEPMTWCTIANDGVLILCLPTCDPLAPECTEGQICVDAGDAFLCVFAGDEAGGYGDPCEFIATCAPGLACILAAEVPGCMAAGCCSPFCHISAPNTCPGMPEQSCVPWYEGEPPPGYEDLGVCAIP